MYFAKQFYFKDTKTDLVLIFKISSNTTLQVLNVMNYANLTVERQLFYKGSKFTVFTGSHCDPNNHPWRSSYDVENETKHETAKISHVTQLWHFSILA
jgi:hypothetical protein